MRRLEILHFSDLHLGVENYSRIDPESGLPTRLLDYLAALDEVVDVALAEHVDLVLFTGDMYKNREPTPTHQRELAKRIGRLARGGVPLFMVVGNHDLPNSPVRAHSVEIFDTLALERVHVAGKIGLHVIETAAGPVQIVALPWVPRSRVIRHDEAKNLTLAEINQRIVETIASTINSFAVDLDPNLPAILAAHGQVYGAEFGSERSTTLGQDYVLSLGDLSPDRFDYIALGHIHKFQKVRDRPPAIYAGSLQRTDFGEEREEKGYVRLSLSGGAEGRFEATCRFERSRAARPFFTLAVDAKSADDPTAVVLEAVARNSDRVHRAIVRLQIDLSAENERQFRDGDVRRALRDASYVAAIHRTVARPDRRRLPDVLAEQLTPREALALYLKAKDVDEARQTELLEYADRLIAETRLPD
ncbi:MAG: exonuclease SbcCD subunit D [Dehalococcoidia bacterium]